MVSGHHVCAKHMAWWFMQTYPSKRLTVRKIQPLRNGTSQEFNEFASSEEAKAGITKSMRYGDPETRATAIAHAT